MRKLPIYEPILSTYPEYGSIFSMLPMNDLTEDWLYSNFIQIYVLHNEIFKHHMLMHKDHIDFLTKIPTIDFFKIPGDFIFKNYESLIEAFIQFVNDGYYILIDLDRFYLRNRDDYNQRHFPHLQLIYGYSEEEEIFFAKDNDASGKYTFFEYDFNDIQKAYQDANDDLRINRTVFIVKNFNYDKFRFNIQYLVEELEFYLESFDACNQPMTPLKYGYNYDKIEYYNLGTYSFLIDCLKRKSNLRQPFHLLYEHKKLMKMRIEFLIKREILVENELINELIKDFNNLTNQWKIMLMQIVKYNLNNDEKIIIKIMGKLETLKTEEIILINRLIELIKNSIYYKKYLQENNIHND